jgi:hypothetical protein
MVWFSRTGLPVPSITRTRVNAMTDDSIFTNCRTTGDSATFCWAEHQHAPNNSTPAQIDLCVELAAFTRNDFRWWSVMGNSGCHIRDAAEAESTRIVCRPTWGTKPCNFNIAKPLTSGWPGRRGISTLFYAAFRPLFCLALASSAGIPSNHLC